MLHLTIKKKWFDMILSGAKREEYREIKPYWTSRLTGRRYAAVCFRNGYSSESPSFRAELKSVGVGVGRTEWGAPNNEVYILSLGRIVSRMRTKAGGRNDRPTSSTKRS